MEIEFNYTEKVLFHFNIKINKRLKIILLKIKNVLKIKIFYPLKFFP